MGRGSLRDSGGEVPGWHWSRPYSTLGYPRTQVYALGARQVASVHGGAVAKSPRIANAPGAFTDMANDPPVASPPPRFHSSPLSWAAPRSGPDASQASCAYGPN